MVVAAPPFFFLIFPRISHLNSLAMNVRGHYAYSDFLNDLDALLIEDDPTLEELEIQVFGEV